MALTFPFIPELNTAALKIPACDRSLNVSTSAAVGVPYKAATPLLWSSTCSSADHQGDEAYMIRARAEKCRVTE